MAVRPSRRAGAGSLATLGLVAAALLSEPPGARAGGGDLDQQFGVGGRVLTQFIGAGEARAVAIAPDGGIVVVGDGGPGDFAAVVRYDSDGDLDPSFGVGGRVLTAFTAAGGARDLVLTAEGGIVVVGDGGADFAALVAYDASGLLDPAFGAGGRVLVPFEGAVAARRVALAPDGGIVVVGDGGAGDFAALMRFQGRATATESGRRRGPPRVSPTGVGSPACPSGRGLTTVRCRLDALLGTVASELPPGPLREALVAPLALARACVEERAPTPPALARASRELTRFGRQLQRHRRRLPLELHGRLLAGAALARAEVRLLRTARR